MNTRQRFNLSARFLFAAASTALLGSAAVAQQPAMSSASSTEGLKLGTAASTDGAAQGGGIPLQLADTLVLVHPSLKMDLRHDDNIYSLPNNRISDRILVLTPALELGARQGNNSYKLRLVSVIGDYQNYKTENYTNNTASALADLDLGTRLRARLEADYTDGYDPRGSTNNALSLNPDHYRQTRGRGIVSVGAAGAQGRLDLELGRWQREYLNNRDTTIASDRTVDDLGATFNWRLGPKTTVLFQGKHSNVDYDYSASTLSSTEDVFLVGGTWEATAKTSGTFRIGPTKKNFDDPSRGDYTRVGWLGAARWSPRTYSHVDLSLSKVPAETSGGVGDYIDRTDTRARWTHAWSSTLSTEVTAGYTNDDYQGATRRDKIQDYGLKATYRMRRWLSFGAGYTHTTRDSDDANFDYKRNVVMFFVEAAL